MKQLTLRQIQDLPSEEKKALLNEMFQLGFRTSGTNSQFVRAGVYIPDNLDVDSFDIGDRDEKK